MHLLLKNRTNLQKHFTGQLKDILFLFVKRLRLNISSKCFLQQIFYKMPRHFSYLLFDFCSSKINTCKGTTACLLIASNQQWAQNTSLLHLFYIASVSHKAFIYLINKFLASINLIFPAEHNLQSQQSSQTNMLYFLKFSFPLQTP